MVLAYKVTYYNGDMQNGGYKHFISVEKAEAFIDDYKKHVNGWNSSISEPEEEEVDLLELVDDVECDVCGYDYDVEGETLICRHCGNTEEIQTSP